MAVVLGNNNMPPIDYTDVYIDDDMVVAQRPLHLPALNPLLHIIDKVFKDDTHTNCRLIVSASKLQKGDTAFSTTKRVLGWDFNTESMTLHLPPTCLQQIETLLQQTIAKKCVLK